MITLKINQFDWLYDIHVAIDNVTVCTFKTMGCRLCQHSITMDI